MINKIKKRILKSLVDSRINKTSKKYQRKVNSVNKSFIDNSVKDSVLKQNLVKWSFGINSNHNTYLKWCHFYNKNKTLTDYVPESVYYAIVEPILNHQEFNISYSDKNFYELIYSSTYFPKTLFRVVDGLVYDANYNPLNKIKINEISESELVIKPSLDSGGGKDVSLIPVKELPINDGNIDFGFLMRHFTHNFIAQEKIKQHSFFSNFNASSLNTIRVLTYRSVRDGKIHCVQKILKVGVKGEFVDNSRAGGFSIGINDQGYLNNFALDKKGNRYNKVNSILLSDTLKMPFIEELERLALEIASKNMHSKILGLDLCVDDKDNVRCIEVNNFGNGINFYQLNNGPLFGHFSDEVNKYVHKNLDKLYNRFTIS